MTEEHVLPMTVAYPGAQPQADPTHYPGSMCPCGPVPWLVAVPGEQLRIRWTHRTIGAQS